MASKVFRRDIVYTIIPLVVSVVIVVFITRDVSRLYLSSPDLLFASIVFLGISLTQLNEQHRHRQRHRRLPDSGSTHVFIFLLLIVSVLILSFVLLRGQAGGLEPKTPDGSILTIEALFLASQLSIFTLSIFVLYRINFKRERALNRKQTLPADTDRSEFLGNCRESIAEASEHIDYLYRALQWKQTSTSLWANNAQDALGFDKELDGMSDELGRFLEYVERLKQEASSFRLPPTRPSQRIAS